MKRLFIISLMFAALFIACDNDNADPLFTGVGTIEKTGDLNSEFVVILDNEKTLNPIDIYDYNEVEDGDRVLVEYTIVEKTSTTDYDVNIYDIDDILTKGVLQLTEQNQDSIGNDPIHTSIENIWISEKHLNIVFDYYGYEQTHYINLVRPIGDAYDNDGNLILEFRHNANDDYPYYLLRGIVSFELESLRESPDQEDVDFVVRVNDYNNVDFEWEGSYTFALGASAKSSKINIDGNTLSGISKQIIK